MENSAGNLIWLLLLLVAAVVVFFVWRAIRARREASKWVKEPPPHTMGMTLNWLAPVYDFWCRFICLGPRFRQRTIGLAELKEGERVLEVGCGTGVLTRLTAEVVGPGGRAAGIDPAVKMIGVARKNAAMTGSRAEFMVNAIEDLPFEDNSFDAVFASVMTHHLPPEVKRKGLGEVYRVLRPGGRLVVTDIDRPTFALWWIIFILPYLAMPIIRENLKGLIPHYLREAGFSPVTAHGHWGGIMGFWRADKPG